jgi:hypothetical protein
MGIETAAIIVGALAATGGAIATNVNANVAREDAKSAIRGKEERERGLRGDLERKQKMEADTAADKLEKSRALRAQKRATQRGQSRADTILTSPLGLASAGGSDGKKTLLGE